jgi:phosphatidylserine/phosphatidylglycerophosphate/cardiolipin synthase-like enzyme
MQPALVPAHLLWGFLEEWKREESVSATAVALALETARTVRERILYNIPDIEVVWTGPYPPEGTIVRNTYSAILEMVEKAKSSILIAGYNFNADSDFTRNVIDVLTGVGARGVKIKMALNNDPLIWQSLKNVWPKHAPFPKLLTWPGNPHDRFASLHAKMLIVDETELLITSANLTYHGLDGNMETGLRVIGGPVPSQMHRHFLLLERHGILRSPKHD